MTENYMVCNCKQVSYANIADALDGIIIAAVGAEAVSCGKQRIDGAATFNRTAGFGCADIFIRDDIGIQRAAAFKGDRTRSKAAAGDFAVRLQRDAAASYLDSIRAVKVIFSGDGNDGFGDGRFIVTRGQNCETIIIDRCIVNRDFAGAASFKADRHGTVARFIGAFIGCTIDSQSCIRDILLILDRARADCEQACHHEDKNRQNP